MVNWYDGIWPSALSQLRYHVMFMGQTQLHHSIQVQFQGSDLRGTGIYCPVP